MYPGDGTSDAQLGDLQTILGLGLPPAMTAMPAAMPIVQQQDPRPPASPTAVRPAGPPPFRVREPWEIPGLVVEPDDDEDEYDELDDYADDPDGYYDDEDCADADAPSEAWRGRGSTGHAAERAARWPGGPPLGSYESRRAALSQPRRRSPLRFILPVLALGVMGFVGVKLFAARADGHLANASSQGTPTSSTPAPAASVPSAAGTTTITSFAGYPGQERRDGGQIAISSVAAGGGRELAVGSVDGYPAVWRQGPGASWSLADPASNGVLAGRPGNQTLAAVADGPAGWLAVGGVVSSTQQHPVVVTSADGQAWQAADGSAAFGSPGLYAYGAAAGRIDYVIVGEQVTGNTVTPAAWWSAGLGTWSRGSVTAGGSGQSSEMFAVTVGAEQFIAAGADGSKPAVWTSPNGQQWMITDLALPAGTSKAALREIVCTGTRVVAVGNAETAQGATVAFAEVSDDGGSTWHEAGLPTAAPQAVVTALTVAGAGYIAAGQSAQSGTLTAVIWTSRDGMTWAPAKSVPDPAGAKVTAITGLVATGDMVSGIGIATTKSGASPMAYTAPLP